jgi:hypothetical protein
MTGHPIKAVWLHAIAAFLVGLAVPLMPLMVGAAG